MSSSLYNTTSNHVIDDPVSPEKYVKAMIIMCFFSTLSNVACFIIFIWNIIQKNLSPTKDTLLVLNLLFSNFLHCLGFMFNYNWVRSDVIETGVICSIQGFLINFGDVTSGFWILVLCIYIFMITVRYECPRLVILSMLIIWPLNLIISLLGLAIQTPNSPFYDAHHHSWCWISYNYQNFRIGFNYFITLAITIVVIILLIISYRKLKTINSQYVNKKLMWYPLTYIILVFPFTIHRFAAMIGHTLPFEYVIVSTCFFLCDGLFNSIIYGFKHYIDVPKTSTPNNVNPIQRRPTPIYGILSPYSPTNSGRMLLSSPSPTRSTFSTPPISPNIATFPTPISPKTAMFSAPISPNTTMFPAPLSPTISFMNSPTKASLHPNDQLSPYRSMFNSSTRNSLPTKYESIASSSSSSSTNRYFNPEKNDSSISPMPVKTTSKPIESPVLEKNVSSISPMPVKSASKPVESPVSEKNVLPISYPKNIHNNDKPRPSTFGSLGEIATNSPSTPLQIELLEEKDVDKTV
ncbi:G protein-coupled receptor [Gigaspora margarita]|uniref:G protein-coupled receptor n=1 Tax=Gigaspora margarita TaxID=4874 RepID=A0A8H4AAM3_GIGMA|nr:G protein-coupled receptor [Gigaspora margarita]